MATAQHMEAKVVVIGDTDVGKTSLSSYYCHGETPASPTPTIGARCDPTSCMQHTVYTIHDTTAAAEYAHTWPHFVLFATTLSHNSPLPIGQLSDEAAHRQGPEQWEGRRASDTGRATNLGHGWSGALSIDGGLVVPIRAPLVHGYEAPSQPIL